MQLVAHVLALCERLNIGCCSVPYHAAAAAFAACHLHEDRPGGAATSLKPVWSLKIQPLQVMWC
jgi:hypothetical protein